MSTHRLPVPSVYHPHHLVDVTWRVVRVALLLTALHLLLG